MYRSSSFPQRKRYEILAQQGVAAAGVATIYGVGVGPFPPSAIINRTFGIEKDGGSEVTCRITESILRSSGSATDAEIRDGITVANLVGVFNAATSWSSDPEITAAAQTDLGGNTISLASDTTDGVSQIEIGDSSDSILLEALGLPPAGSGCDISADSVYLKLPAPTHRVPTVDIWKCTVATDLAALDEAVLDGTAFTKDYVADSGLLTIVSLGASATGTWVVAHMDY